MGMFCRQVFNRLHKLGLCLSPSGTLNLLGSLGEGHDEKIFEWQDSLLERLQALVEKQVRNLSSRYTIFKFINTYECIFY